MWVSEIAALRPWLVMFWVLAKALGAANPGEPPGMNVVCLIVAETGEQRVLLEKLWSRRTSNSPSLRVLTGTLVKLVQGRDVDALRRRVKLHHRLAGGVDHGRRESCCKECHAACDPSGFGGNGVSRSVALEASGRSVKGLSDSNTNPLYEVTPACRQWILREVSVHHGRCRNQALERMPVPLPLGLVVDEEECLVFLDGLRRATPPNWFRLNCSLAGCEVAAGVELGVAEELEQRSVKLVRFRTLWLPAPSDPRAFRIPPSSCK